jgi:hypothetical protein
MRTHRTRNLLQKEASEARQIVQATTQTLIVA